MTKQKRTSYRVLSLVSLSLLIAAATYGFAEANTISGVSGIGAGYGVKSSYEVSRVSYTLDLEDPGTFTAVEFTLEGEGSAIFVGVSGSERGNCESDEQPFQYGIIEQVCWHVDRLPQFSFLPPS